MSVKRKDKKGRILRNGEYQRSDGRYQYEYTLPNGKVKSVYSWLLEPTDKLPAGKRKDTSLREKERYIQREIESGLTPFGNDLCVLDLVKKYAEQKTGVRPSTENTYQWVIGLLRKDHFGTVRIDKVKISDAKMWLIRLQKKGGKGCGTLRDIRNVVRPAFQMAVDDDLIRKNPFDFSLTNVLVNDCGSRTALTRKEQEKFLEFIKNDGCYKKYYDAIFILFHTGMRISEFAGLTINDIDFENGTINIDHQLQRTHAGKYVILPPKTLSGERTLPMTDEVAERFRSIIGNRSSVRDEPVIDGYSGFLMYNQNKRPIVAERWAERFRRICAKYNSTHDDKIPVVTPHVCRHTYCTRMANSGINPKYLQYLMGHSNISLTLNVYTHVNFDDIAEDVRRLS